MAPNEDPERPRASSAAERQKSIVSMTEFEGMDEYTALQKYILFYRDSKTNPHAEQTVKKKAWWQFWKSGSATAATAVADPGAVPEDCKYLFFCLLVSLPPFTCPLASHSYHGTAKPAHLLELHRNNWWLACRVARAQAPALLAKQ